MFQMHPLTDNLLRNLPAAAFCYPRLFSTSYDNHTQEVENYEYGLDLGKRCHYVTVAVNNVWSAYTTGFCTITSSEKIGYHGNTAALLAGFIASGCEIRVYRDSEEDYTVLNKLPEYAAPAEYALD
jgi:hypothetical protein